MGHCTQKWFTVQANRSNKSSVFCIWAEMMKNCSKELISWISFQETLMAIHNIIGLLDQNAWILSFSHFYFPQNIKLFHFNHFTIAIFSHLFKQFYCSAWNQNVFLKFFNIKSNFSIWWHETCTLTHKACKTIKIIFELKKTRNSFNRRQLTDEPFTNESFKWNKYNQIGCGSIGSYVIICIQRAIFFVL